MDEVMGELKTIREEQSLQSQHLSDHDDRIEKSSPTWVYLQISPVFPQMLY
jgi:hypothetical protein